MSNQRDEVAHNIGRVWRQHILTQLYFLFFFILHIYFFPQYFFYDFLFGEILWAPLKILPRQHLETFSAVCVCVWRSFTIFLHIFFVIPWFFFQNVAKTGAFWSPVGCHSVYIDFIPHSYPFLWPAIDRIMSLEGVRELPYFYYYEVIIFWIFKETMMLIMKIMIGSYIFVVNFFVYLFPKWKYSHEA